MGLRVEIIEVGLSRVSSHRKNGHRRPSVERYLEGGLLVAETDPAYFGASTKVTFRYARLAA
jgi:hypothetical protein